VPFFVRPGEIDSGRHGGIARLKASPFNRLGRHSDDASDGSATRTRHVEAQHRNFGEFRVPGLRQVGRTGPYMHDGSLATLEDVVKHYSTVSPDRLHSDGVPLVRPLGLTFGESADLVAFLRTLDAQTPQSSPAAPICPERGGWRIRGRGLIRGLRGQNPYGIGIRPVQAGWTVSDSPWVVRL
jgi:cytochrome c peroxidase